MAFKEVTHIIFDLDGLLIDSEKGYDKITSEIAQQYGKEYTMDVRAKILGTPEDEAIRIAVREMQLPISTDEFEVQYRKKIKEEFLPPNLLPGAEKLIRHFHKHGIPFAMATSASKSATDVKIKHFGELFSLFTHRVMGSSDPEVKRGKPNPDIFLVCASRFADKPKPEKCLIFEDAPNGVTGGVAAGMQVVIVPGVATRQELCQDATLILKSLEDFKPELFGLPSF